VIRRPAVSLSVSYGPVRVASRRSGESAGVAPAVLVTLGGDHLLVVAGRGEAVAARRRSIVGDAAWGHDDAAPAAAGGSSTAQIRLSALVSPGKRPITLVRRRTSTKVFEQIHAADPFAVLGRPAQVRDALVEVAFAHRHGRGRARCGSRRRSPAALAASRRVRPRRQRPATSGPSVRRGGALCHQRRGRKESCVPACSPKRGNSTTADSRLADSSRRQRLAAEPPGAAMTVASRRTRSRRLPAMAVAAPPVRARRERLRSATGSLPPAETERPTARAPRLPLYAADARGGAPVAAVPEVRPKRQVDAAR
jgi:hypothetical protein